MRKEERENNSMSYYGDAMSKRHGSKDTKKKKAF